MSGGKARAERVAGSGKGLATTETTVPTAMARNTARNTAPTTTKDGCLLRASSIIGPRRLDELDDGHVGAVTAPRPDPHDPGVATRALLVAGSHLVEELGDHLGVADVAQDHPASVQCPRAGTADHLLGIGAKHLRFGDRGRHLLVPEQLLGEVAENGLLVSGVATKSGTALRGRHQSFGSLLSRETASDNPSSSSLAVTSSRLFCPKLVMLSRSSSVLRTNSPTVVIWARRRQLRGRSDRSSASMGRSRSGDTESLTTTSPRTRPTPSPKSANRPSNSPSVLPAEDTASIGETEPSVWTSSTSLSKLVILPTCVEPTV